ncbi:MAG: hypothetical protein RIT46_1102 [Pseudomonadota bacterium]|jgi:hypothetical protein
METTSLPQGSEITGNVLFYQKPEPLSRDTHGKLGLRTVDKPFGFAATTNVVPLTVTEFAPAAIAYPIIFAGEGFQPLAVMGVAQGTNLFISADGSVEPDAYLPAYIRRYPFVLAGDEKGERLIVCIDRASSLLAEGADVPMFENGEPTEYTTGCIQFCNDFEAERQRTDNFVKVLKELDLFETRQALFNPRNEDGTIGDPQVVAEYFAISEEKLLALPQDKFMALRDNGALSQIYAHLVSLLGWDKLITKVLVRNAAEQAQA